MSDVKRTKVKWIDVAEDGYPEPALRIRNEVMNHPPRTFLVRGEHSLECAYAFEVGPGFHVSDSFHGPVLAWAVIEGF